MESDSESEEKSKNFLDDISDSESEYYEEGTKKRRKRRPKYTKQKAMEAHLKSLTETGHILRSIGFAEGAPRAGRDTVEAAWELVDQTRPQKEIKKVMIMAAQIARSSGKKTITAQHIHDANEIILDLC